ncbi:MAG: ATP-binding protein [Burkholderiaceae bacterium]|nr:ATP-binding protein [Burkholderiaceae bacterium]
MASGAALRRAAAAIAGLACAALPALLDRFGADGAGLRLDRAEFLATVDSSRGRTVALPHRWHDDCADCVTVWYRFDLPLAQLPRESQAIYLPAVGHNAAVYLNGQLLGQGGPFTEPVARLDDRPLLALAPPAAWNLGSNRLLVLVKGDPPQRGFMPVVHVGAADALADVAQWRWLTRISVQQVLAAGVAMLGLVMLLVWLNRRSEAVYGWLALACAAWAVQRALDLVLVPWLRAAAWDSLAALALASTAAAVVMLARRMTWRPPMAAERGLLLVPALAVAAALAGATDLGLRLAESLSLLVLVAAGVLLAYAGARARTAAGWLLLPGLALAPLALHDLLLRWRLWPADQGDLLGFATPVVLGTAGWALLTRFVDTLNAAELLNVDLEAMVADRARELQAQFARVRELERGQVLAAERERLMRDMHDGLGGNLVSLLAMIEGGRSQPAELTSAVHGALDDMRLMVDSLDPVDDDLNVVLAMYRDRIAPRLRGAGVDLQWNIDLLPPLPGLSPARVLNVLRLLQEAVTNAVRHGRARRIEVDAAAGDGAVTIEVADDGCGFDPATVARGRGLRNMAHRAREAGADLNIDSRPGAGARVRLRFALGAASDAALPTA